MTTVSYERITRNDLRRLARIANEECEDFFSRRSDWKLLYGRRFLAAALYGREASHFCNGSSGIEQFNLCLFFGAHAEAPFPHRWASNRDFGQSKFGHSESHPQYDGRRVQVIGRSVPHRSGNDVLVTLESYVRGGRTPVARQLREQAVVLISPERFLGHVLWPTLVG